MNRRIKILISVFFVTAIIFVLNIETSIMQGVDGHQREIKMPLYAKGIQFLARHYEYARLAREITKNAKTDKEKVLRIFDWTHENIKRVSRGMPVVDDHVLNIIIRGYGTNDQFQDVFTTLCAYNGIPAFWDWVYDKKHRARYPFSFVVQYDQGSFVLIYLKYSLNYS